MLTIKMFINTNKLIVNNYKKNVYRSNINNNKRYLNLINSIYNDVVKLSEQLIN